MGKDMVYPKILFVLLNLSTKMMPWNKTWLLPENICLSGLLTAVTL